MTSRTRDNTTADAGTATTVSITGTADQVNVTKVNDAYTLSAPQSIATTSSPQFAGMKLNGLAAIRPVFTDASKNIVSTGAINNGQLMIGRTGFAPAIANLIGSTDQIWVIDGPGSITISTPQNIATRSSPTFAGMTLAPFAGTTSTLTSTTVGGTSTFGRTDGVGTQMTDVSGGGYVRIAVATVSTNNNTLDDGFGTMIVGALSSRGLTPNMPVKSSVTNTLTSSLISLTTDITGVLPVANGGVGTMTNGQLLVGQTGMPPIATTLTGTAARVTVTNASGVITLSTPQDIDSKASPTFTGLNLSGSTANRVVFTDSSKNLVASGPIGNGQIIIGVTGGAPVVGSLTGTPNQITALGTAGNITLSTPQDIATTSSPTFAGMSITSPSATATVTLTSAAGTSTFGRTDGVGTQMTDVSGTGYIRIAVATVSTNNNTLDDGGGGMLARGLTLNSLTASTSLYLTTTGGTSNFSRNALGTQMQDAAGNSYVRILGNVVTTAFVTLDDGFGTITGAQVQSNGLTANMPVKCNGTKTLISGLINLTSEVTGVLPEANGGLTTTAQTIAGAKTFSSGILLPTTGGTPSSFNAYSEFTHTTNWSGPFASIAGNIAISVIGKMVFLNFPQIVTTGNSTAASITSDTALPAWLRPSTNVQTPCIINATSSDNLASIVSVLTSGIVTIRPTSFVNDTYAATSGSFNLPKQTCSYSLQ